MASTESSPWAVKFNPVLGRAASKVKVNTKNLSSKSRSKRSDKASQTVEAVADEAASIESSTTPVLEVVEEDVVDATVARTALVFISSTFYPHSNPAVVDKTAVVTGANASTIKGWDL